MGRELGSAREQPGPGASAEAQAEAESLTVTVTDSRQSRHGHRAWHGQPHDTNAKVRSPLHAVHQAQTDLSLALPGTLFKSSHESSVKFLHQPPCQLLPSHRRARGGVGVGHRPSASPAPVGRARAGYAIRKSFQELIWKCKSI